MIKIERNISLKSFNTFQIEVFAEQYILISSQEELIEALDYGRREGLPIFILNGGSNILFTKNVAGLTLHLNLKGIRTISKEIESVIIETAASENWDDFVAYCVAQNWAGLENLSLIPGNVGTSPMQNIGAYGVEMKDSFHQLKALHIESAQIKEFDAEDCAFGYRESFFKNEGKGQYIIVSVQFRLMTSDSYQLKTGYGAIQSQLDQRNISTPCISDIRQIIINIRRSKLPDPKVLGNAGSFFKNPVVSPQKAKELSARYSDMPYYEFGDQVKIPAGWLIETAGWKGKRVGECGVYAKQALILVNYGGANGSDIYQLSEQIIADIDNQFDIKLEREVNIY